MICKRKCENCGHCDTWECTCMKAYYDTDKSIPCKYWIGIKYDRVKQKKNDRFEFELATAEENEDNSQFYYNPEDAYEEQYWDDVVNFMIDELLEEL